LHLQGLASYVKTKYMFLYTHVSFESQTVKFANERIKTSCVVVMWKLNSGGKMVQKNPNNKHLLNFTAEKDMLLNI
jgi:predicted polyphosphate/ATP-dependent NAD kinase